jgi:uncharacterized protein YjiK
MLGCGSQPVAPKPDALQLIATHALSIREPSDVTINETGTRLWVVSDPPTNKVYELNLKGKLVKTLKYSGNDCEGIFYDRTDSTLWLAEEEFRAVVHLDLNGNVLSTQAIGLTGEVNSGTEGICIDDAGRMFMVNEKHPGAFLELNPDHTLATETVLDFARDYSSISYNREKSAFWVASDQSAGLYLWSKPTGVINRYSLPFTKFEGVAVDDAAKLIYMVNDSLNALYIFKKP